MDTKKQKATTRAYDVYLDGKEIDTVFCWFSDKLSKEERLWSVKDSLVNHDGYNSNITIKENE